MASNQTANYGLNQWEATDKVMREDFNADNRKIEEALAKLQKEKASSSTVLVVANCVGDVSRALDALTERVEALEKK